MYTFYSRGSVSTDPEINDRIWQHTPEREQAQDPEHRGIALIIDLVRASWVRAGRRRNNSVMERSAAVVSDQWAPATAWIPARLTGTTSPWYVIRYSI